MTPIHLTERTISRSWDKEAQEHVSQISDTAVLVNPEQIAWVRATSDAPEKYASHLRMTGGWDLFVIQRVDQIEDELRLVRQMMAHGW